MPQHRRVIGVHVIIARRPVTGGRWNRLAGYHPQPEVHHAIRGAFEELKIDVFGPAAVVTGLFAYEASAGDDRLSGRVRCTVVMVDDAGDWNIAHEHLSVLPEPG